MTAPTFVHDANLRLPVGDPPWRDFLTRYGVDVLGFSGDMAPLAAVIEGHHGRGGRLGEDTRERDQHEGCSSG